ncbi:MAG: hypothetical protein R6X25_13640 [Candidatus Krumholzibacteriia bacterium]
MRVLLPVSVICLVLGSATGARALQGTATGFCDAGSHVVTISGTIYPDVEGTFTGLVLVREAIGVCAPSVTLPEEPLPFEPQPGDEGFPVYTATAVLPAPADAAVYRYQPYAIRADGGLEPLDANCGADMRSYALVACGSVPFARGSIAYDTGTLTYRVELCPDDCWTEPVGVDLDGPTLESLAGEPAPSLVGVVVDVYGTRTYCRMLGGDLHEITALSRTEDGACGPVPASTVTWGDLKAIYR